MFLFPLAYVSLGYEHGGLSNRRIWEMCRTVNLWLETHIFVCKTSLKTIYSAIITYLCQKGGSIE